MTDHNKEELTEFEQKLGKRLAEKIAAAPPPERVAAKGPDIEMLSAALDGMASKAPPASLVGMVMEKAVHRFIVKNFGRDGIYAVMKDKKVVGKVVYWSRKNRVWRHLSFADGEHSLMSAIYHDPELGFAPTLNRLHKGWPPANKMQQDLNAIGTLICNRYGREEEDLDVFDRLRVEDYETGARSRFLFGDRKVCEVWREGGRWQFRDGVDNEQGFFLRKDFGQGANTRIADDEEYERNRPALIRLLTKYCEPYEMDDAAKKQSALIRSGAKCSTGNAWLDDLFIGKATMFAPVPLRPLLCFIGTAGAGKSALARLCHAAYGQQIFRIDLDKETFTGGDSLPRLREHRAKLMGSRGGISMDLATDARLDSGFVKPLSSNEAVSVGGMYKSDITRPLEFFGMFSSNEMPQLVDDSEGTTDRIRYLPLAKKIRGSKDEMTHEELMEIAKPLFPTMRRMLLEFVKALVLHLKCKVPANHPMLQAAAMRAFEDAEYALKTYAKKFFRPVDDDVQPGSFDYNYRKSGRAAFCISLGGATSDTTNGFQCGNTERSKHWLGFRALAALHEHVDKSGEDSKVARKRTLSKLLREGQSWHFDEGRGAFTGRVHTEELIRHLNEHLHGEQEITKFLTALYSGATRRGGGVDVSLLLTDAMRDIISQGDDGEAATPVEDATPPEESVI